MTVVLDNGVLRAEVTPGLGGTIQSLQHLASGLSVLGRVPWDALPLPEPDGGSATEASWLARFAGGWPLMFPNAGDACRDGGIRHGFHGEGSVTPWTAWMDRAVLVLTRRFFAAPVTMTRRMWLTGDVLHVAEHVMAEGDCTVVWGQHVTFGADLMSGPVTLSTSAARLAACATYDPPANPLLPGTEGNWPHLPGPAGRVDLSTPPGGIAALACLRDLGPAPWAELRRADGRLAARLSWTADPWPLAWLWIETGGTRDAPWFGRGRIIGIEPCSTWPATGLASARAAGGQVIALMAGEERRAHIFLTLYRPNP